jgi:hypothetical protein
MIIPEMFVRYLRDITAGHSVIAETSQGFAEHLREAFPQVSGTIQDHH